MNAAQSGGHHTSSMGKKGSQLEELVAVSPERRNWRGIFIALLVIAAVFSLIIFSIFLLSPEDEASRIRGRRMTLSDVIGKSLKWKPFNGTWLNDIELVYRDPSGGLSILNLDNYTTRVLMTNSTFRQLNAESFMVSPDQKYVLLISDTNPDEGSRYHVYEVQTRNTFPLAPNENTAEAPRLQYVTWAPNSFIYNNLTTNKSLTSALSNIGAKLGASTPTQSSITPSQAIAFVYKNDIYYKPKVQGELVCRITSNGKAGEVFNGIPDWTYENIPELKGKSLSISPDNQYMAYFTYNDSSVHEYQYTWNGNGLKYSEIRNVRYPKTGTLNPNVSVNVVNLGHLKLISPQTIKLSAELSNNSYIGGITWATPFDLSVTVTNREQTQSTTIVCRAPTFQCQSVHTEVTVGDGWLLPGETPIFSSKLATVLPTFREIYQDSNLTVPLNSPTTSPDEQIEISNGGFLLKRLPVRDGEHGHYRHVVFISSLDKRTVPLTMGQYEVTEIVGWDEPNETVYFMAAPERKPGERHLYKIFLKMNVTKTNRTYITSSQPICLTCDNSEKTYKLVVPKMEPITNFDGYGFGFSFPAPIESNNNDTEDESNSSFRIPNNCKYNKVYFSRDYSYYVQECLGPESPSVYLVETATNTKVVVLNGGDELRSELQKLALPQFRTFSVEIRHGFHAQVRLMLPPGMKEEEEIVVPLILQIDAGPGSQLVSEKYEVDWNWYLCSQRALIIAQIDARGSGYQGELLRTQLHGKLGTVEVEDQLGVLSYLREHLKFIDPERICAYGWGYGGYATTMTLIDDSQQVLSCAVAINPIVSFAYHHSFFTERYIPTQGDFLRALQESDLTMKAGNIKGRNYMVIHGTADTYVHKEHSLMLAKALIDQEVKFRQQIYTDEDHDISGSLYHLYKTVEWYFDECFGPTDDNEWDPTGLFVFKQ